MLQHLLAVCGLTYLVGTSKLLSDAYLPVRPLLCRWRWLEGLVTCSFCCGFWASGAVWLAEVDAERAVLAAGCGGLAGLVAIVPLVKRPLDPLVGAAAGALLGLFLAAPAWAALQGRQVLASFVLDGLGAATVAMLADRVRDRLERI